MDTLIYYAKCAASQRAKDFLACYGIPYQERDIVTDNPSYSELKGWTANRSIKTFINSHGLAYRALKHELADATDDERLKILATDGMLIKRPILITRGTVLVGFDKDVWYKALEDEINEYNNKLRIAILGRDISKGVAHQLEYGAKLLLNMNSFRRESNGVISFGYENQLDGDYYIACTRAKKIFSLYDCPLAEGWEKRGREEEADRIATREWMEKASIEVR